MRYGSLGRVEYAFWWLVDDGMVADALIGSRMKR